MGKITKSFFSCLLLAFICTVGVELHAQSDKEVIIVEKIKDENGNIISKKILRSSNGDLTEAEIEEVIKESESSSPFGQMFDFNNFDFGDLGIFNPEESSKPTLGVMLSFDEGHATITEVMPASGAEEAELREGDIIVSMDGLVVNSIEDIKVYLSEKGVGDQVLVSIIRDGQSFDKKVSLKNNRFNSLFGNMDPKDLQSFGKIFDFYGDNFQFDMDSILNQYKGGGSEGRSFQFEMPNYSDRSVEEDKANLGVFIEETDEGVIISEIMEESAAEKAKLKVNDRIVKIDGNEIRSFEDLARIIKAAGKNTKLVITYERNGKTKEAEVILN